MNQQQCSDGLRPIIALFSLSAAQLADYVAAILESCGWMDGYRFDRVCKDVLAEVGIQKPRPAQFIAKYRQLEERGVWPVVEYKCPDCGGSAFRRVSVIPPQYVGYRDGTVLDAAMPCKCNPVRSGSKPGALGNPVVTTVDAPASSNSVEALIIRESMKDPDYEAKVRRGWLRLGFAWPGPLTEGAAEMLRQKPEALKLAILRNVRPNESEDERRARLLREVRD